MDRMNNGMKSDMDMNGTDLAALRMLIVREQRGESISPHDIAHHLRISSASTTKLLDRLADSGHIVRVPHPRDRRARVVQLTPASKREFFRLFRAHLRAMEAVADDYSEKELLVINQFMDALGSAIDPRE
ncbi:MarR family winged helix-turn-helix transcriptional regulator [Microbacterium sp. C7(2022)]|uniref:MarR family winged helix-turn-helix transcriptional regulator n=1 Tax=Microbacterium sp. C7(2022) TaxID=2992759 RepID=UPI00237A9BE4|nr:MarR family transcriptional regulator [Microbacterium sp. C7(2022)]MDE0545674.1 MarR family transcriptional regulator [Microbacterium sp. C7(2022)]